MWVLLSWVKISPLLSVYPVRNLRTSDYTSAVEGIKYSIIVSFLAPLFYFYHSFVAMWGRWPNFCNVKGVAEYSYYSDVNNKSQKFCRSYTSHNVLSPSISAASASPKRRRFWGRSMELWKLYFPQPPRPAPLRTVRNATQHLSLPAAFTATLPDGPWTSFFQLIFFQPGYYPAKHLSSVPSALPSSNWAVPHLKRDADPV